MSDILRWSAVETAAHIRGKDVSITEVTQAHLTRMERANPALNAITHVIDGALELAKSMDAGRVPEDASPLFGVPVTVKVGH